jgi:hypothetical protein
VTPDSSWRTLAARSASCWDRKTALGAPSARQCEPRENGLRSSRLLRPPRFGRLRRLTNPFCLGNARFLRTRERPEGNLGATVMATAGVGPRRAMIRRRGKRGRIRRAEATEAYENRTLLTNDAPGLWEKRLGTRMIQPNSAIRRDSPIGAVPAKF